MHRRLTMGRSFVTLGKPRKIVDPEALANRFRREIERVRGSAVERAARVTMGDGSEVEVKALSLRQLPRGWPGSAAARFCASVIQVSPTGSGLRFEFSDETHLPVDLASADDA